MSGALPAAIVVRVQRETVDVATETRLLSAGRQDIGAVVSFTGLCRDEGGKLAALELEHYPGMAEAEIGRIGREAVERFGLLGLTAIHRVGMIIPGDTIVLVLALASHRQAAFDGAAFVMDYLKTDAPFWKKEHFVDGTVGGWVAARASDDRALDKWS